MLEKTASDHTLRKSLDNRPNAHQYFMYVLFAYLFCGSIKITCCYGNMKNHRYLLHSEVWHFTFLMKHTHHRGLSLVFGHNFRKVKSVIEWSVSYFWHLYRFSWSAGNTTLKKKQHKKTIHLEQGKSKLRLPLKYEDLVFFIFLKIVSRLMPTCG